MDIKKKNIIICIIASLFFVSGFILFIIKPENDYSISERRKLQKKPEISMSNILNGKYMTNFEKYTMDQFPFRENLRKIKTYAISDIFMMNDKNGLYEYNGFISNMDYPLNKESIYYAANRFKYVKDRYLTEDNAIYVSIIPDKNIYLANKSNHLALDFSYMEDLLTENMPYAKYIPIKELLNENDYYKTDTHFKQEKIINVSDEISKAMDSAIDKEYKIINSSEDFYGVYHGQYAGNIKPDKISYLTNDTIENMKVYDGENKKEIPIYDIKKLKGKDPYELFLSGPLSLVTINNPNAVTDRRLIMFRDSFGSSIAPLLATAYKETILIDIRYISPVYLDQFVSFENSDILFLYSSLVLNNSNSIK